jgi:hypothetical protein
VPATILHLLMDLKMLGLNSRYVNVMFFTHLSTIDLMLLRF